MNLGCVLGIGAVIGVASGEVWLGILVGVLAVSIVVLAYLRVRQS